GRSGRPAKREAVRPVLGEPHNGREPRRVHCLTKTTHALGWNPDPHSGAEHLRCQVSNSVHHCCTAREHDTRAQTAAVSRPIHLPLPQRKDFVHTLVDDVRKQFARNVAFALRRGSWQQHCLARWHQRLVRRTVALLETLGVGLCDAQPLYYVASHLAAAIAQRGKVTNLAFVKDGQVRSGSAHLHQRDSELLFVFAQHRECAGERFQYELAHLVAGLLHRLSQVHGGRAANGHEIHLRLETHTDHAYRVPHAARLVYGVL